MSRDKDKVRIRRAKVKSKHQRGKTGDRRRSINSRRSVTRELGQSVTMGRAKQNSMTCTTHGYSHVDQWYYKDYKPHNIYTAPTPPSQNFHILLLNTVESHLSELQLSKHVSYPNVLRKTTPTISGCFRRREAVQMANIKCFRVSSTCCMTAVDPG